MKAGTFFKQILLALLLCVCAFAKYSGGTGEPNDPYLIATPEDLNSIGFRSIDWNKHFKMIADINMAGFTGTQYKIIGNSTIPFTGVFDGNDNTIFNLTYSADENFAALFGVTSSDCIIKDLTLYEPSISGGNFVGGLVAKCENGVILNCHIIAGNIIGRNITGGLIGWCNQGEIVNCGVIADVNGGTGDFAGGLIAVSDANISRCFAKGTVRGYGAGGLIGTSHSGIISDCYANVTTYYGSGFIGSSGSELKIARCYATGYVDRYGFTSSNNGADYTACFWDRTVNPDVNGIGNGSDPNVTALPTEQMQQRSTFADADWDMVNIWDIGENQTYPFLRKHLPGDINKDNQTNLYDLAILADNWLKE